MKLVSLLASLSGANSDWDLEPPVITPTTEEAAQLKAGATVVRQDTARGASSGVAMAWVEAPPEKVWAVILDFDAYVEFLPYVTSSKSTMTRSGQRGAELELTTKGYVTRYHQVIADHRSQGYLTFQMRPLGWSPLRTSSGWWRVTPWEGGSLVVYSVDVATAFYLPKSTHDKAAAVGLPRMVELVADRARK